jgi:hypothetical protein
LSLDRLYKPLNETVTGQIENYYRELHNRDKDVGSA